LVERQVEPLEDVNRHRPHVVVFEQVDDANDGRHVQEPEVRGPFRRQGTGGRTARTTAGHAWTRDRGPDLPRPLSPDSCLLLSRRAARALRAAGAAEALLAAGAALLAALLALLAGLLTVALAGRVAGLGL